ncbi:MAG: maleylpyruvate isomerase family mycothiol-dependent enzyme [Acidimicrobiales bacterium]
MNHEACCSELDLEVNRFAEALSGAEWTATVPSCPDWTVRDLTQHLGTVHRWADQLVRARAATRIGRSHMNIDTGEVSAEWLRSGGRALSLTLRSADPDESMWAWGADQHVRFWSRRQLHETMVHRIDLELAMGVTSVVDPAIAADAVDEFLANLKSDRDVTITARSLHDQGERLKITTADGIRTWNVVLSPDRYDFVEELPFADAVVTAEPRELLMLLLRRRPRSACDATVAGDESLLDHWLEATSFQ